MARKRGLFECMTHLVEVFDIGLTTEHSFAQFDFADTLCEV